MRLPIDNRILSVNVALLELLKRAEIRALFINRILDVCSFPLFNGFSIDECIHPKYLSLYILTKENCWTYLFVDDHIKHVKVKNFVNDLLLNDVVFFEQIMVLYQSILVHHHHQDQPKKAFLLVLI